VKLPRRRFLHLTAAAAALPAVSRIAWAQAYPSRPLRWIVGFPPGGGADTVARIAGQWLSDRLGQPVIIENKPGGGTNISVQAVVNSPPDGYTLPFGWVSSGDQRDALSIAALQLPTRYRAGCRTCLVSVGIGGAPIGPGHGR